MEQKQIPQRRNSRVRFSELLQLQDKEGEFEKKKEKQFPRLLQTESFKVLFPAGTENLDFPWNMLRMGRESEPIESEYAAAIAAAAFAIHSLEETTTEHQKDKEQSQISRRTSRKGGFEIADNSSMRRRRSSDYEAGQLGREIMVRANSGRSDDRGEEEQRRVLTKAEAWERDELNKIDKRYRNMIANITEWENERKMKAKLVMEKKKAELERLKNLTWLHYQRRVEWIDSVARGAKSQLENGKRSQESNVMVKARKIKSTGKTPVKCLCFEYFR